MHAVGNHFLSFAGSALLADASLKSALEQFQAQANHFLPRSDALQGVQRPRRGRDRYQVKNEYNQDDDKFR
jgi:hypothetical protein